jgi:hypothetical protein
VFSPPEAGNIDRFHLIERLAWFMNSTVGQKSLAAGIVSAAWGTALNKPKEYGPHWEGFGKRYGMRLTGVATGNAIEAELGGLWGEDPATSVRLTIVQWAVFVMLQPWSSSLIAIQSKCNSPCGSLRTALADGGSVFSAGCPVTVGNSKSAIRTRPGDQK